MLTLAPSTRVFVATGAFDMRGSFDALAGAVRRLGLDPVDGHLYLFFNARRRIAKLIWFDRSGWCVLSKRLERGSFQLPDVGPDQTRVTIEPAALSALLAGFDIARRRPRWYRAPTPTES